MMPRRVVYEGFPDPVYDEWPQRPQTGLGRERRRQTNSRDARKGRSGGRDCKKVRRGDRDENQPKRAESRTDHGLYQKERR